MRKVQIAKLVTLLVSGSLLAAVSEAAPAKIDENLPATPCQGLLCDLTPSSMAMPITVAEAARLEAQRSTSQPKPRQRHQAIVAHKPPRRAPLILVHVVLGKKFASLSQLSGQPVSFGLNSDPAQKTARKAFSELGVAVQPTSLDLDNALDGIATGDIAAAVVVRDHDVRRVHKLIAPDFNVILLPKVTDAPLKAKTALLGGGVASASRP